MAEHNAQWEELSQDPTSQELDQNEIDSLLGFDVEQGDDEIKGIKAMIDRALDTYERLPMLEVIFQKFVRLLSASLRNLTEDNVEVDIKSIQSLRFGSYINSIPIPTLVVVFRAEEWENYGILVADSALVFSLIDVLFGGKNINRPVKIDSRPYTSIEQNLVKELVLSILEELSDSFSALSPVNFTLDRIESDPRFANIARHGDSAILAKFGVTMDARKGTVEVLFPNDSVEPIKNLLTQVFIGDQFDTNFEWRASLINNVHNTELKIDAILNGKPSCVEDIANLKVGNTIIMQNSPNDDIAVFCNGIKISEGKLGKIDNKVAIALNKAIETPNMRKEIK